MKSFLKATPEGWKCDPGAEQPRGIALSEDVLRALGCVQEGQGWELTTRNYVFRFRQEKEGHWRFTCPGTVSWHSVTHLDECLGFVADDGYRLGRETKLAEVRDALGIGGDVGKNARI